MTSSHKRPVKRIHAIPYRWLPIIAVFAALTFVRYVLVYASDPEENAPKQSQRSTPRHSVYLAAGDKGPFFSIEDLATYTPPPKPPAPTMMPTKRAIRPPIWKEYPAQIRNIPIVSTKYTTETIQYLASHEVEYGDRDRSYVSITFDCESGKESVISILDTLREQEVKATFFVLGRYAYLYPEIVRQIVVDGHEVGNHSFFHPLFTEITPITATQEITYTEAVIDWAVGQHVPMRYFRFPYGGRNKTTRLHAASLGYQSAFWDIDPRGWAPEKNPQDVVEHVRHTAHKGGIIIMHCGSWNDANALADVIQLIRDLGMIPGTLTDVLTDQDYSIPNHPLAPPRNNETGE